MLALLSSLPGGRFTLAALLAAVTFIAAACALLRWTWAAGHERAEAVAALKRAGIQVHYGWEREGLPYPYGPAWIRGWLGDDALNHGVSFSDSGLPGGEHVPAKASAVALLNRLEYLEEGYLHDQPALGPRIGELQLPRLKRLVLIGCGASDAELSRWDLPALEELSLEEPITGACLADLVRRSPLRLLHLYGCQLDEKHLASLVATDSLTDLTLHSVPLTDRGVEILSRNPRWTSLCLSRTKIGDGACRHLARMTAIERLTLDDTAVSEAGLRELATLVNLRELSLDGCPLGDDAVEALLRFPALKLLSLHRTCLSPAGAERLRAKIELVLCDER